MAAQIALPAGWDDARIENATDEDWDALTDEDYELITDYRMQQARARLNASRAERGLPPAKTTRDTTDESGIEQNIVDALQRTGLKEFGFVIFKATDASDDKAKAWQKLKQDWPALSSDGRSRTAIEAGNNQAVDEHGNPWPTWLWIEEPASNLQTLEVDSIARQFEASQLEGQVPPGLDQGVVLVVTAESLASFELRPAGDDQRESADSVMPWVYAVDTDFQADESSDPNTKGYFKVSVQSLLTNLWPALALDVQQPDELEAAVDGEGVWEAVF